QDTLGDHRCIAPMRPVVHLCLGIKNESGSFYLTTEVRGLSMRRERRLTKSDLERHLAQGRQTAEIAAETGYTVYQIRAAYGRHGLRPPYQGSNPRCSRQEFIALVTGTTLTLTEIAEKIGVTLPAVSVRARRLGLKTSLSDRGGIARVARKITAEELQAALDA